jgi:hypothetical protein
MEADDITQARELPMSEYRDSQWPSDTQAELQTQHTGTQEGRPARDTAIQGDDLVNLRIALNTARSLEEFLDTV